MLMTQSMLILIDLENIKETALKFYQRSVPVLQKIANYQEMRVKLTNEK